MAATDLADMHLPATAVAELQAVDPVEWIDHHRIDVGRSWWTGALADHDFDDTILGETISRADIFAIADRALEDPDAAITLLWNALAWGSGEKRRNNKARIAAVAQDRTAAGQLLQHAARISRADPLQAYDLLYPENKTAISDLGPAFFTKYLYFAGAGSAEHRCSILDENVALSLNRTSGWKSLPSSKWLATAYERYALLLDRWTHEHAIPRHDTFERWLFEDGKRMRR
jgi:hypothetical protein